LLLIDATCRLSGAAVGSYLVFNSSFVSLYLSLFTGFVIYIATSHILPEAHASHDSRATMLMTVLGVGVMWIVVAGGA
jgi:ZIP family zinc transporter